MDQDETFDGDPATATPDPETPEEQEAKRQERFQRNLEAFKKTHPEIYAGLKDHRPTARLEVHENGEETIRFQEFDMYPRGARTETREHLDRYWIAPDRMMFGSLSPDALDRHAADIVRRFGEDSANSGIPVGEHICRERAYFAFVLGIGLGYHLERIVEKTDCRILFIVEPNRDFFYFSLFTCDWAKLLDDFKTNRHALIILGDSNIDFLTNSAKSVFRAYNPGSVDGTYYYRHYQSSIFAELQRQLQEHLRTAVMGLGFFQDEVNMIGQTYKNLEKGTAHIIARNEDIPAAPVFIVGTGPSLDSLLPFIEKNQDRAIIVACGTAIDVLLEHGIRPDFHANMERAKDILKQTQETAELYDMRGIRFVGSTTLFPGVTDLYDEAILFFRPGLSSAPLFARSLDQIAHIPDPLAANGGLSFAMHMGFREYYFLGVDVGSAYRTHGHARKSWYERHDAENIKDLSIPLPGNFGGTVWTTQELMWSKHTLEALIRTRRGRVFYNLGNGAAIAGTVPKHPKAVRLPVLPEPKDVIARKLVEHCPYYTKEMFDVSWIEAAIIDRLPEFCEKLKDAVADVEDVLGHKFLTRYAQLLEPREARTPLAMMFRGTVYSVVMSVEHDLNRIADPDERKVAAKIFVDVLTEGIDAMRDRAIEVFTGLENGDPWDEEFVV